MISRSKTRTRRSPALSAKYLDRVEIRLLVQSKEQSDFDKAFREWSYAGNAFDLKESIAECELCGHSGLRFQYEIANSHTSSRLLVGSRCINRFRGIRVQDADGADLDEERATKRLASDRRRLIENHRHRRVISSLVQLASNEDEFDIDSFIKWLLAHQAFTPKQMTTLIWRFEKHGVAFDSADFKVTIRRNKHKQQLFDLPDWQLQKLWPCLSPSQQESYQRRRREVF